MSRSPRLGISLLSAFLLTGIVQPPLGAVPAAVVTDKVDCTRGQSINKALDKHSRAETLIVEITGMCHENVVVARDRLTLRGADPANDGIEATANVEQTDAAVWVRGGQLVVIENLTLTGGFSGLVATNVNLPSLRVSNSRLEGNTNWGAVLEHSLLDAFDTVFGPNDRFAAGVFLASRLACTNCTFTQAPAGTSNDIVFVVGGSQFLASNATVTSGGVNVTNSQVNLTDSSLQALALPGAQAMTATVSSGINLSRTQVAGPMRLLQGTTATLAGVTQTPGSSPGATPNSIDDAAFVKVVSANPAVPGSPIPSSVLGFALSNFSNATLQQPSQVTGNISCSLGANAVCPGTGNVSGTANCGLCIR